VIRDYGKFNENTARSLFRQLVERRYWPGEMPGQPEVLGRIRRPPIPLPDGYPGEPMQG
jgi:hypothetical protein